MAEGLEKRIHHRIAAPNNYFCIRPAISIKDCPPKLCRRKAPEFALIRLQRACPHG
jgi:hypothetical protein